MNFEDLFEDLEAQFDSVSKSGLKSHPFQNGQLIEIELGNSAKRFLIAPIFGNDYLAGLDPVHPRWYLFPHSEILRVKVCDSKETDLPSPRFFNSGFSEFISQIPVPCAVRWQATGNDEQLLTGQLHSVSNSLLFIYQPGSQRPIGVPISALQVLIVEAVDNLNGSF